MFTKLLASLVMSGGLLVSGHAFYTATGSCCQSGADCCFPGSPCCVEESCCYPGSDCCFPSSPCCDAEGSTSAKPRCETGASCCER